MEIREVTDKRLMRLFTGFPYQLYRGDPNFVPDLRINQKKIFSDKNPFFEHSQAKLFLALKNGKVSGRIAGINNTAHNRIYKEKRAFFGFLEVVKDYDVFNRLIEKVIRWSAAEGFDKLTGPTNFTTNDSCGFLISGFDRMPVIHMPYNKDYYPEFFERFGFRKELDLFAWELHSENVEKRLSVDLVCRIEERLVRDGITIRQVRFSDKEPEIMRLMKVYNASNEDNWGFIPLTENEFRGMAMDLKTLIPEKLILFAEKNGDVIGFVVALPDYNQVLRHIPSGRLLPAGIFKFLWYRRKINNSRVLILGVLKGYKNRGIDLLLYRRIQENLATLGIHKGEAAYVMETNYAMNSIMRKIGGTVVKKYRIFSISLNV